jgi:hypothetical protein
MRRQALRGSDDTRAELVTAPGPSFSETGLASIPHGGSDEEVPLERPVRSCRDHDRGYECDGNNGVGQGNPAHGHNCGPVVVVIVANV